VDTVSDKGWERRVDRLSSGMAAGITFLMYERTGYNVRGEVASGPRKEHFDGTSSLTLALDQHKYGDELIAQLYTTQTPRVLERRADGWSRVQVYLGPADLATARVLEEIAGEIRARIAQRAAADVGAPT
jgi:hypothetical protein